MAPTIDREVCIGERLSAKWRPYTVGDVVYFTNPTNPSEIFCKRLLALEGDIVLPPYYAKNRSPIRVPAGHVWVEGDNPEKSVDSKTFGPIPINLLHGRVTAKILPFSRAGLVVSDRDYYHKLRQKDQELQQRPQHIHSIRFNPDAYHVLLDDSLDYQEQRRQHLP